jgi:hypothetical protein
VLLPRLKADGGEDQGSDLIQIGEVVEAVIPINYSDNWQGDMKRTCRDYIKLICNTREV